LGLTDNNISVSAAKMIPLFNLFAGGPLGSGKQWYCTQFLSLVTDEAK